MSNENLKLAKSVFYNATEQEIVVTLQDGSRHAWPVHLLEMVKSEPDGWVPLKNITDEQLSDVVLYGGGKYILWDELGQSFVVSDLLNGIYGREEWMRRLCLSDRESLLTIAQ